MKKFIGCEVGNYDTKLITKEKSIIDLADNKDKQVISDEEVLILGVKNVVAPAQERRTLKLSTSELISSLDVTIETKEPEANGRWFVGDIALREGSQILKPTQEDKKSKNPTTLIMILTTIAYALYDPNSPSVSETIGLGTLLPTEEYFNSDHAEIFKQKLKGEHTVTFNDPAFKNAKITFTIDENIELIPEGAAGQIGTVFNWDGFTFDKNYNKKTILNIDIGYIDTDVSIFHDGDFLSKGFFGFKSGTKTLYRTYQ